MRTAEHPIFADYRDSDPRAALREMTARPVSVEPRTGALIVTAHPLVQRLLLDPGLTNMPQRDPLDGLPPERIALHRPVTDFFRAWGGHHAEVRRRLLPIFGRHHLNPLLPRLRETAGELLRGLRATAEPADWVRDFCRPYCLAVLGAVFGASDHDMDVLARSTDGLMAYVAKSGSARDDDLAVRARASIEQAGAAVRAIVLDAPASELAVALRSIADDPALGRPVAVAVAVQIITGTMDPLTTALTETLLHRADPGAGFTDEVLRLSCPFRFAVRYATRDMEVEGHRVRAGQRVLLVLGAANLDEDVFPEPLEFRPDGRENRHLAFGRGAHMCIGSGLARAAIGVAADALATADVTVEADPATLRRAGHLGADQILGLTVRAR
ncbi:cytochrome P450 [Actinoplanes rectilineatus]|uniref:cytochrome P450 n=1 Tax=Actinoplanes rectilineatus TaxID=113571 RepID=UPI0005F2890E|nr:cytochrome P450 [Actinoplanes rectilineatus]